MAFNFGIMGAGRIARQFCDAARRLDGVEVAAVSSKNPDKASRFAEEENIGFSGGYEDMLAIKNIDAVYIATTHNFHHENALLCLRRGKPVLIEKPMATSRRQAGDIFDLAEKNSLFVMEAMWSRFHPHIRKAREWVADGAIGKPVTAHCAVGFIAHPDPESRLLNPALAGGAMYDLGVYAVELMTYLINKPVTGVKSEVVRGDTGVDVTDTVMLDFDGCAASLHTTFMASLPGSAAIYGTEGHIMVPRIIHSGESVLYRGGEVAERFEVNVENGFIYEIEETVRCVREGLTESPVVPHADTLLCCEIFDEVLR
ncbi:MAG: Gfo/Idh/MocA family oxidoreductase [Oscillospiraceae bacterium]|nr:Gfo/Idh/MocA family oxidoreductase [Oscillospiraceae bacterium]